MTRAARRRISIVVAAGLFALGALSSGAGQTDAVASRTSDGVAIASPAPQASAAAAKTPVSAPGQASQDVLLVVLALVAAGGFARAAWLLRGHARQPRVTTRV